MSKKNIIIALLAFVIGFGVTFYVIKTYFPKQKSNVSISQKEAKLKE
jgi:hypothetical protein